MKEKLSLNTFLLAILYAFLPLVAYKAKILFLPCIFLIFMVLWFCSSRGLYYAISSYIISFSFFGISIAGIKLFDIVLIFILIYMLINNKINGLNFKYDILIIFIIYILFIYVFVNITRIPNNYDGYIEIIRYIFAFLALIIFSQRAYGLLNRKKIIRIIDFVSIILIIQTIVMSLCHKLFGDLEQVKSLFLTVDVFNYDNINNIAAGNMGSGNEARVSAFFSDPNKLMIFFFCLLFVRKLLKNKIIFDKYDLIYLLGALLTGARTSVIVATIYIIVLFIATYFKGKQILGYVIFALIIIIFNIIIMFNDSSFMGLVDGIMDKILILFGRQRTLSIDSNISTDGRIIIWKQAFPFIKQHILFGNGLLSEKILLPYPTHNTLIQLLLDTGIVGLVLFLGGITKILWQEEFLPYFLVLIGISSLFLDLANYNFIYFVLGFIICFHIGKGANDIENNNSWTSTK